MKHEKREAAGRPPKSKNPSTSTRTHPVSTGLTTSVVLKQLKKDQHQQLYGKEQTEDQDTPIIADSSSQDNEDIIKPPSRWQQPSSQAPSSQEPKEGDEDYEASPPVPRRVQEEAYMALSVVSQMTQASRPTVAQKVPPKKTTILAP